MIGAGISNGHKGHNRSRHCERPPIGAFKNQAETKEKSDIFNLQQPAIKTQFSLKLRNKYDILQDYDETDEEVVEKQWQDFEDAYKNSSRCTGVQKERTKSMDQQGVMGAIKRESYWRTTSSIQDQTGLSIIMWINIGVKTKK